MKLTLTLLAFPSLFAPLSAKSAGQVQALRLQPTAQTRPRPAQTPESLESLMLPTSPHLPIPC